MKELKELMLEKLEELGWSINEDNEGAEIEIYTEAGEDFFMYIPYTTPFELAEGITCYYEDFDPDEHALMMFDPNRSPGIRLLIKSADSINDMLRDLSFALSEIVEKWREEHRNIIDYEGYKRRFSQLKEYTIVIPVPMNCIVKASSPEEAANKLLFSFGDNESDICCEMGSFSDLCDCVGDTVCVYGEDGSEHIVYVDNENYKVLNKENE